MIYKASVTFYSCIINFPLHLCFSMCSNPSKYSSFLLPLMDRLLIQFLFYLFISSIHHQCSTIIGLKVGNGLKLSSDTHLSHQKNNIIILCFQIRQVFSKHIIGIIFFLDIIWERGDYKNIASMSPILMHFQPTTDIYVKAHKL